MRRKLSRKRTDEGVIKTERDYRRADRENDDTFDLTDEEAFVPSSVLTTVHISRYVRSRARKSSRGVKIDDPFPFLTLPPEVRNMVYQCVLVSTALDPIRLDEGSMMFAPGGIETAILLTNRAIYNEAIKILYDDNRFRVQYSVQRCGDSGPFFRVDNPRDASATSRQLRSGRSIDMVNHRGLIYKDVFYRLRNIEFHIDLLDRTHLCDHLTIHYIHDFQCLLGTLYKTIAEYSSAELKGLQTTDGNRSLIFRSRGMLGHGTLRNSIKPILAPAILEAVRDGKLKVILEGAFPVNWESIFTQMMGPMFSAKEITVIDNPALDPKDLDAVLITM